MLKTLFQSSHNPEEISLTIKSAFKVLIYVLGYFAAVKGFSPTEATNQLEILKDLLIQAVPIVFAVYHAAEMVYGAVRKMFPVKG